MLSLALALLLPAHADDAVSMTIQVPGAKHTLRCPGAEPLPMRTLAVYDLVNGATCRVVSPSGRAGTVTAKEGATWVCTSGQVNLSCAEALADAPPAPAISSPPPGLPGQDPFVAPTTSLPNALRLYASLPDPGAATALSGFLGFGSGHFYAGEPEGGYTHLSLQLSGIALAVASVFVRQPRVATSMGISGGTMVLTSRVLETLTAPRAAHRTAEKRLRALQ